jgi:hypothetical protein
VNGKWKPSTQEAEKLDSSSTPSRIPPVLVHHVGEGFLLGIPITIGGMLLAWFIGDTAMLPYFSIAYSYGTVVVTTTILVKRHGIKDMMLVARNGRMMVDGETGSARGIPKQEPPFMQYFVKEYAIPWGIVLFFVNFIFTLKGNVEGAITQAMGNWLVSASDFSLMVLFTSFFVMAWTGSLSMAQIPTDVKLGRIFMDFPPAKKEAFHVMVKIGIFLFIVPIISWIISLAVIQGLGIPAIPVWGFLVGNVAIVIPAGMVGLRLGMPFGLALDVFSKKDSHEHVAPS